MRAGSGRAVAIFQLLVESTASHAVVFLGVSLVLVAAGFAPLRYRVRAAVLCCAFQAAGLYGLLTLGGASNVLIRPRLVGQKEGLPALAMFIALFGGAASMGLKGLIVGPVLMSLAFAVLKLYVQERPPRYSPSE